MDDTAPEVKKFLHDLLMARSGQERFLMGCRSSDAARQMVMASLPQDLPREEFRRRYFKRIYGRDLEEFIRPPTKP